MSTLVERAHDLPPRWDGFGVEWHGWEYLPPAFLCPPPPPQCCRTCGAPPAVKGFPTTLVNRGYVERLNGHPQFRLHVFRCQVCRHDVVTDTVTGGTWDLDDSDYGDDGSVVP